MQKYHTRKLFYGKFPYKILLSRARKLGDPDFNDGWTIYNAEDIFKSDKVLYKMYNQTKYSQGKESIVTTTSSVFLATREDFDKYSTLWKPYIQSVTSPFKDDHVEFLKNNTEIIIRDSLIYRKYKYVVTFKRAWKEDISDLFDWVSDSFVLSPSKKSTAKWVSYGWNPRVYLTEESDFVLLKLAHSDRIRDITIVCTFDELARNNQ